MKRMQPTAWFWVVVAAVVAVALFTVGNVHGQENSGSAATFEGRPAMAGAQAGTGAMAGPPQGGLAPQSPSDAGGGIAAQRNDNSQVNGPAVPRDPSSIPRDPGVDKSLGNSGEVRPQRDRDQVIKRDRDENGVQQQGRTTDKAKRAGKRTIERARHGLSGVD